MVVAPRDYEFAKLKVGDEIITAPSKIYTYNATHLAYEFALDKEEATIVFRP